MNSSNRMQRVAKLWDKAKSLANARKYLMDNPAEDPSGQHWYHYGNKAKKAAAAAYSHDNKQDAGMRRTRLAKIASLAREKFNASHEGSSISKNKSYKVAAKAFKIYKKFRYPYNIASEITLAKGGQVFFPMDKNRQTGDKFSTKLTKREIPLVIQKSGTKRIKLDYPPSEGPYHAILRHKYNKAKKAAESPDSDKFTKQAALSYLALAKPLKDPRLQIAKLPSYATTEPDSKRISKPTIRKPTYPIFRFSGLGQHPSASVWKKPIGRREMKSWRLWYGNER